MAGSALRCHVQRLGKSGRTNSTAAADSDTLLLIEAMLLSTNKVSYTQPCKIKVKFRHILCWMTSSFLAMLEYHGISRIGFD